MAFAATHTASTADELNSAIAAASDGDVIQLTANNITLTAALTIDKNITLDLNGNTFKTGNLQKYLKCTGNVTITNGSYYMGGSTGLTTEGALTLNGVTFTNGSASKYPVQLSKSGASVTITDTDFGTKKADVQVLSSLSGTVTITSNKAYDNFAIEGTSISTVNLVCNANMTLGANTKLFNATKSGSGTLTLTGGIYGNDATRTAWTSLNGTIPTGYTSYNTQINKYIVKKVVAEEAVPTNIDEAEVGGLQMAFADAIMVVPTDGTIDILKDIEWTSFITVLKSCTIQGKNGVKNINIANPKTTRDVLNCPIKFNTNNINLTLKDLNFTNNSQYGLITNVNGTSKGKTGLAVTFNNVTFANPVEVTAYTSEPMTITDASNTHKVGYYTAYTDYAITTTNADAWNTFFGREKNILVEGYVAQNVYNDANYATIKNKFPTADDQIYLMKDAKGIFYRGSIIQTFDFANNVQIKDGDNIYRYKTVLHALAASTEAAPAQLLADYSGDLSNGYLDLNGYKLTYINPSQADNRFANKIITFSNSRPNETGTGIYAREGTEAVFIVAASTNAQTTAKTCQLELTIKQGVKLICGEGVLYGIEFPKVGSATKAYGLVVNFDGEIINNNPNCGGIGINGNITNSAYYNNNPTTYPYSIPQINIGEHANISIANGSPIYAAGYAIWNINGGTLTGKSGVQIKSGKLNINGGTIHATGEGSRVPAYNSGMIESGAAVQIESNASYAGKMEINIANGATLTADGWYAIHEYVANSNDPTAVDSIKVTGGNFTGGILISQALAAKGGFVSGGKWSKDVTANVVKDKAANPIEEDPYFFEVGAPTAATAVIENTENKNAVLTNATNYDQVNDSIGATKDVTATAATNQVVVTENTDVVAQGEGAASVVEVKKVTVEGNTELNVKEGATLIVGTGSVTLDTTATTGLTVEAGAALVVDGLVYGSTADNFVIEGQENNSGIVLFSPETEFIKEDHPTATYRFTSKSFKDGSKWVYQRFGMPSFDGNVTVKEGKGTASSVRSFICTWDYAGDQWGTWSELDKTNGLAYDAAVPFQCYQLGSDNAKAEPVTYDFVVSLMGNANKSLNFKTGWNPYANSYTAPIDIKEFLEDVVADAEANGKDIQATVYLYQDLGNDTYTWQGINLGNVGKAYRVREGGVMVKKFYPGSIRPMQAFIMKLASGNDVETDINYADNVYAPALSSTNNNAPARRRASYNEMQIGVFNDLYWDNISVMEGEQFSADLDNGYDACKYDHNRGLSLYVINGATRMERIAIDNAEGLMVGIDAPVAGQYTLDFSNVNGEEFAIIDMTNNALINVVEDGEYTFYAEAGANDYRFQIVKAAKMPTAIENIEASAAVKGIYTITGQFLGYDFNRVPAGVYVVNGVKVVK